MEGLEAAAASLAWLPLLCWGLLLPLLLLGCQGQRVHAGEWCGVTSCGPGQDLCQPVPTLSGHQLLDQSIQPQVHLVCTPGGPLARPHRPCCWELWRVRFRHGRRCMGCPCHHQRRRGWRGRAVSGSTAAAAAAGAGWGLAGYLGRSGARQALRPHHVSLKLVHETTDSLLVAVKEVHPPPHACQAGLQLPRQLGGLGNNGGRCAATAAALQCHSAAAARQSHP